ncbi:arylesterase [Acinetobacter rudis]|uniref:Acyl-CoA thioesterase I n=1 Tax=Acinetobacter rudis CIP 110305 TaxID=421052 RepID=S3N9F6_9GAMM|nr:acyl-CoA thioesterase I [Acinetobacter rudis CIP 110305]
MLKKYLRYLIFFIVLGFASSSYAKTIMILGDSISAGFGIAPEQGWVSLLQKRLDSQKAKQHKVINASVSGETTSGALARLPKLLQTHQPDVVVIELGGNDGLRGGPPQMIQNNLAQLIQLSQKAQAKVVLLGMKLPPNYGTAYNSAFENNYKVLSQRYKVTLLPFFMQGVAGQNHLMQADKIHPNAKAQMTLLNNAFPSIKSVL